MRSEQLWLEGIAREVRRLAGVGEDDNVLATALAVRLLGKDGIVVERRLAGAAYLRRRTDGGYQIAIRPDLPDVRFAICHEIAHYALREIARVDLTISEEERAANYLGAAIIAPAKAVARAYKHFGPALSQLKPLSKTFGLSQTSAHLRVGEVAGENRAVRTAENDNVLSRGSAWKGIDVPKLASGELRRPDVVIRTLRGGIDEGRVALRLL